MIKITLENGAVTSVMDVESNANLVLDEDYQVEVMPVTGEVSTGETPEQPAAPASPEGTQTETATPEAPEQPSEPAV